MCHGFRRFAELRRDKRFVAFKARDMRRHLLGFAQRQRQAGEARGGDASGKSGSESDEEDAAAGFVMRQVRGGRVPGVGRGMPYPTAWLAAASCDQLRSSISNRQLCLWRIATCRLYCCQPVCLAPHVAHVPLQGADYADDAGEVDPELLDVLPTIHEEWPGYDSSEDSACDDLDEELAEDDAPESAEQQEVSLVPSLLPRQRAAPVVRCRGCEVVAGRLLDPRVGACEAPALRSRLACIADGRRRAVPLLTARLLRALQLSDADAPAELPLEDQHEEMQGLGEQRQELLGQLVAALGLQGDAAGECQHSRPPAVECSAGRGPFGCAGLPVDLSQQTRVGLTLTFESEAAAFVC